MNLNINVVNENEKCGIYNNKLNICNTNTFCADEKCKRVLKTTNDIQYRVCSDTVPLNREWTLDDVHYVNNVGWVGPKHNCFDDKIKCEANVFNDNLSYNSPSGKIDPQIRCWVDRKDAGGNPHRFYVHNRRNDSKTNQ
jgi:hypothetical protein